MIPRTNVPENARAALGRGNSLISREKTGNFGEIGPLAQI
jgi:hypothetical protein